LQIQEIGAGNQVRFAVEFQGCGSGAGGEHDMTSRQEISRNAKTRRSSKARRAMIRGDSRFDEVGFALFRHRIGERSFESHEICPLDPCLAGDAAAAHSIRAIFQFGRTHQYLLGIAAA
jgi:hypothetical protein